MTFVPLAAKVSASASATRRLPIRVTPFLLLAPFLSVFLLFLVVPLVISGYNSLFVDRLIGGEYFAGLANYAAVFQDGKFWNGMGRIALYGAIVIPVVLGCALFLAIALSSGVVKSPAIYRLILFLPYAVPGVVATLLWGFLYGKTTSPATSLAAAAGFDLNLLSSTWILPALANIGLWLYLGYNIAIFTSALQAIPTELYEAAAMEGASRFEVARYVQIPLLRPVITLAIVFSIIGNVQLFTEPLVLQPLTPNVIKDDFTPNLYAYNLISTGQSLNYVSALAFTIGALTIVFSGLYLFVSGRAAQRGVL